MIIFTESSESGSKVLGSINLNISYVFITISYIGSKNIGAPVFINFKPILIAYSDRGISGSGGGGKTVKVIFIDAL
jgi:hypothetical protein